MIKAGTTKIKNRCNLVIGAEFGSQIYVLLSSQNFVIFVVSYSGILKRFAFLNRVDPL